MFQMKLYSKDERLDISGQGGSQQAVTTACGPFGYKAVKLHRESLLCGKVMKSVFQQK